MPKKAQRILKQHQIPRIKERVLISHLWTQASRNEYDYLIEHHLRRKRLWHVVRAVWNAHLAGKLANVQELSRALDVPRATVARWLVTAMKTGIVGRNGTRYFITERYLVGAAVGHSQSLVDRQIKLILDTADALRRLQRPRR